MKVIGNMKILADGKYIVLEGGATWPTPMDGDGEQDALEWRLRYAQPEVVLGHRFHCASIVSAYRELIALPAKKRNKVIASLRRAINGRGES